MTTPDPGTPAWFPVPGEWRLRILDGNGRVAGAGILIARDLALTCAQALVSGAPTDTPPDGPWIVEMFPQLERRMGRLHPQGWFPSAALGRGDVAVLQLSTPVTDDATPAVLRRGVAVAQRVRWFGFPRAHPDGIWAQGGIAGVPGPGIEWVPISQAASGTRPGRGFNGAGVIGEDGAVIGMIVATGLSPDRENAWMMPMEVVERHWPGLTALIDSGTGAAGPSMRYRGISRLVSLIEQLRVMDTPAMRDEIVDALRPELANDIPRTADRHQDIEGFVNVCARSSQDLTEFIRVLRDFAGYGTTMRAVEEAAAGLFMTVALEHNSPATGDAPRHGTRAYPGYLSDVASGEDLLGRSTEIAALATLIAARDTDPPLSVGLFGDWGTGKTFFIERLRREVGVIANLSAVAGRAGQRSSMCTEIRQIVFNAWHYTDADLWASLVAAIFAELAAPRGTETEEQARQRWELEGGRLVVTLETTRQQLAEVRAKQRTAAAEADRLRAALADLERQRSGQHDSLATLTAVATAALADPQVTAKLADVRDELDIETGSELQEIRRFADDGVPTARRLSRLWRLLRANRRSRLRWWLWTAVAAAVGLGVAVPVLLQRFAPGLVQVLVGVIAFAAPLAVGGSRVFHHLNPVLRRVEAAADAAAAAERAAADRIARQEKAILAELARLDHHRAVLAHEILLAETRVDQADLQLREARSGRHLAEFIQERSTSRDYRGKLGVIAMIRRDFDRLAELLHRTEQPTGGLPIERIVLYVDDLDRCSPDRVVEVLQAIHLLLGLRLFVVVVAVDPRWLLGSLELHFERVLGSRPDAADRDSAHWAATPTNYLEKIFQIPYNLSSMGTAEYRRLIGSLLYSTGTGGADPADGPVPDGEPPTGSPAPAAQDEQPDIRSEVPSASASARLTPPRLTITAEEREYAQHLAPLISTPRAAKRLINLYRLTRAAQPDEVIASFVESGTYQAVLLLLAILVGAPTQAVHLFSQALQSDDDEKWVDFVERVQPADGLTEALAGVAKHLTLIERLGTIKPWIMVVSRYSFHTGRLAGHGRPSASTVRN